MPGLTLKFALLAYLSWAMSLCAYSQSHNLYDRAVYLVKASNCLHDPVVRSLTGFRVHSLPGIVTALHGVADCSVMTVTSVDGIVNSGPVTLWKVDIARDLALLQSTPLDAASDGFEVAQSSNLIPGSKVWVVGYPLGTDLEETKLPFDVGDPPLFQLERKLDANLRDALQKRNSPSPIKSVLFLVGPLNPGHSGAPVLDASNRVVAVADGSVQVSAGFGWAIPFQGIEWTGITQNAAFQALKQKPSNIALFNWFGTNPDEVQQRITRKLDAIKEDTARILELQGQSASKNRLEILRDYVPRIDDNSVRFSERCIALSEAINALVFRDSAAFEKTAELMHEGQEMQVSLEDQRIGFPQLEDSLADLAADHLNFIASEFYAAKNPPKTQKFGVVHASEFWWEVFQKAMSKYPELTLARLSAVHFDEWSYPAFDALCANLPSNSLVMMDSYPSGGVRGLAALQRVYGKPDEISAAVGVVRELVNADSNPDLLLASAVLREANRKALIDPSIATDLLRILKDDAPIVSHSMNPGKDMESRGREFRFFAAEDYLVWLAQFKTASDVIQAPLLAEAEDYEHVLQSQESDMPPRSNGDLYAYACIRALISLNASMFGVNTRLEDRVPLVVSQALSRVFSHSAELLDDVNLQHLAETWQNAVAGRKQSD